MLSRSSEAYFWLGWDIGTDAVVPLTIYQKQLTPIGAANDPYGPPIYCPICRKREMTTDEVIKYGPIMDIARSRVFEIPDAPAGSLAGHTVSSGTPPRGTALTVITLSQPPLSSDGANGNWCFDSVDLLLFGPKASGAWPTKSFPLKAYADTVVQEADGTNWTVKKVENVIFDRNQILFCVPEI